METSLRLSCIAGAIAAALCALAEEVVAERAIGERLPRQMFRLPPTGPPMATRIDEREPGPYTGQVQPALIPRLPAVAAGRAQTVQYPSEALPELGNPYESVAGMVQDLPVPQPDPAIELEIDQLLQEAEAGPTGPPPELGAGIGARLAAFNPNISVIGDFQGVLSTAPDVWTPGTGTIPLSTFSDGNIDGFRFEEIELLFTAAIDPYADGLLKLAFSSEGVEIEEAYALFHDYPWIDKLPPWFQDVESRFGIFRMEFGPLNLVDGHDLPSVDRPPAQQLFLGEEGLIRAGMSFSKILEGREPWVKEIVFQFTNGAPSGDEEGSVPFTGTDQPLGLFHVRWFRETEGTPDGEIHSGCDCGPGLHTGRQTLEIGTTFAATGNHVDGGTPKLWSMVQGLDITWQWFDPDPRSFCQLLFQTEVYVSELELEDHGKRGDVGSYILFQTRHNRQLFTGLRFDITEFPGTDGYIAAVTPYATWFITEFNRVRFQYQYLHQEMEGFDDENVHTLWAQLVFAYGAHPPEPYFVGQRF